ncbi:MAG: hypothetical protein P4L43_02375, partial [Syntrophobacteraceae bacterium]|nr:hypothetical protein [Syntrophobacteraceae bacterium]
HVERAINMSDTFQSDRSARLVLAYRSTRRKSKGRAKNPRRFFVVNDYRECYGEASRKVSPSSEHNLAQDFSLHIENGPYKGREADMDGQPTKALQRWPLSPANNPIGAVKRVSGGYTLVELCMIVAILGILSSVGMYSFNSWKLKERNSKAMYDIKLLSVSIDSYCMDYKAYPQSLNDLQEGIPVDPWGNPYQYLNLANGGNNAHGQCRKDRNLNPINTDYDLFSMGADGQTQKQLNSKYGQDDVIRAQNGAYLGLAGDF